LHQTSNPVSSTIFGWIYEPLLYQDLDNTYKGLLAESWAVSSDNRAITFKLRKGVTFTDGSPFNAEAVKFTFERLVRVGAKSPIFETFKNIASAEAKDETTFVLNMKEPSAPIFHDLQTAYVGILSPSAVKAANDSIGRAANRPPFDNAKLRQALSRAVNKSEIVQVVFENKLAKVSCCPIAESIQGYDPKLKDFELGYDVAKAKAGLDELGYKAGADGLRATPDGKPFKPVLYTSTSDTHGKISTLLQAQFKAVGVDLQIKQLEAGALLA